jgi:hypothetical protein
MAEPTPMLTEEDAAEIKARIAERTKRDSSLNAVRNHSLETENPDDVAYDIKKSSETGIPREAIGGARDQYKDEDTLARMERLAREAPSTRAWLQDGENYAVARDDMDSLSLLEKVMDGLRKTPAAIASFGPAAESAVAGLALDSLEAPGLTPIDKAITQNIDSVRGLDEAGAFARRAGGAVKTPKINTSGFRNPFDRGIRKEVKEGVSGAAINLSEALKRSRATAIEGATEHAIDADGRLKSQMPRSEDPTVQGYLSGVSSLVQMAPAMGAGFVTKKPSSTLGILGRQVYGQSYSDVTAEGELGPGGKALYAGAQSGIERGTEMLPAHILFGKNQVGKDYLKRFITANIAEGGTEQVATLGQNFVDWQVKNPEKTVDQFVDEMGPAAYETMIATIVASGAITGTVLTAEKVMTDMEQRQRLSEMSPGEKALDDLITQAGNSKLAKRSPEKMQDFVSGIVDETTDTIAIDLDGLSQTATENGLDPNEMLQELGLSQEALQKAADMTGSIEVPTAKVLTSRTVMENADLLKPHMRFSSESLTPFQREAARASGMEDLQKVYSDFLEGKLDQANADQSVTEQFMASIEETGMYGNAREVQANATVLSALVGSLAKVRGISVEQAFEEHGPQILGHFGLGQAEGALDQSAQRKITSERYENPDLTESERKAVEMLFNGVPRATIEDEMMISPETLRVHLSRARAKGVSVPSETGGRSGSIRAYAVELKSKKLDDETIAERIRAKFGTNTTKGSVSSMLSQERVKIRNKGETPLFQMIGPKAKTADKAILKAAKKMAKKGASREDIWKSTAEQGQPWYQDENGDWISEIEDGTVVVRETKGKMSEVIEYPSLYANYPQLGSQRADARDGVTAQEDTGDVDIPGTKGTYTPRPLFWSPHVRISDQGENSKEYTAVHELQHAIDHVEGRTMGDGKPYLLKDTERRAFNTMYRRLWTMAERIAIPPWVTESEAIDWFQGGREFGAPRAQYAKDGTYDPNAIVTSPELEIARKWMEGDASQDNAPQDRAERRVEQYGETTPYVLADGREIRTRVGEPTDLIGRTFLSKKEAERAYGAISSFSDAAQRREGAAAQMREVRREKAAAERDGAGVDILADINKRLRDLAWEEDSALQDALDGSTTADAVAQHGITDKSMLDLDKTILEQKPAALKALNKIITEEMDRLNAYDYGIEYSRFTGMPVKDVLLGIVGMLENENAPPGLMQNIAQRLQAEGIVGGFYTSGGVRAEGIEGPPQFQSVLIFDQSAATVTRDEQGNLMQQAAGQFLPRDNIIHLFEAKNVSTLMHESMHWYFETLLNLQAKGQSTPEIDTMLADMRAWYDAGRAEGKYDSIVARYDIVESNGKFTLTYDGESKGQFFSREEAEKKRDWREMHEALAETFEVYLRDGKAPNAKLRDAFRFFRQFLMNLYRKVKGNPSLSRANLNPEITAIFDRMLAVDDMVDGASSVLEIEANQMLQKMLDDGVLTEKEHARAVAKFPKMLDEMKEDLSARLWNSAQKRQDAIMAGFKRDIRDAVAREYDTSPVGRAEGMLGRNEWMGDVVEDEVVDDVNALAQAKATGYQGEDRGEAKEWLAARAKGLDMSTKARMDRADDMGFTQEAYHGTDRAFAAFDTKKRGEGDGREYGFFTTENPDLASDYADDAAWVGGHNNDPDGGGATVMRLRLRLGKNKRVEFEDSEHDYGEIEEVIEAALDEGYDSVSIYTDDSADTPRPMQWMHVIFDAKNIRSVNAAFDPDMSDSANLLNQEAPRSLGAMTRMTDEQIGEWYVENIREVRQDISDGYGVVNLHFKTDDSLEREDAVVNFKIDGNKVNADLYLNSKTTADVNIKELTDAERKERQRKAANMFARAVAAIKHWVALEQPGAVVFSGSSTDHEKLYNFLLSTLAFEGYTAHRINTIIGRTTTEDNVTSGEAILPPMQQFVVLKDGENLGDYSETESVKGRSGTTDTGTWQGYHAVHTEEIGPVRTADGGYERRGLRTGAVGTQRSSSGTQGQIEGATNGNAQGNNGLDGSVPDGKLQGPVVLPDGTTELVHYGREQGLSRSDPSRWGAGGAFLPRSERNRISDAPARTYFGLNVGLPGGYTKEEGTGDNTYYSYIPFDRLYDFGADADNLVERGREIARERRIDVLSAVEHAVKDAGYAGFYRDHPSLGMVGAVFEEIELASERRQEAVSAYESITEPGLYQRAGDGRGRDPGRRLAPLAGAPSVQGAAGPDARIVSAAEDYAQSKGIDLRRQSEFVTVDEGRARRIADAYEQMQHAPNDPSVQEAYASLISQTVEQYNVLTDAGFSFTFFDDATDPYAGNPWNAMRDLRANQTMAVYGTYAGYGTEGITASALADNPMLSDTGLRWPDQNGVDQIVTANDLFRAVHDAFGHGIEGAGFRARGEENAWQAHVRLFTGPAIGAITSETRGQNSWLNFGPYGESNRSAQLENTVFAEQKTGLMPEWTWQEGRARDAGPDPDALNQTINTHQDRNDFLDFEAVSEPMEGEPQGSVRYAFKLPGQIEPVMVDVVVDPEYNAQQVRIGEAVQDGTFNKDVSFETGLRDLAVRLYAIVERHIRKGPLFFRTTSPEDRAFAKEILTHAAENSAQDLRVHIVNNHAYLIQRPGTISTSDGSVSNGGFSSRQDQGRPSAQARAEFYRRAKSHDGAERRREAVARRDAKRESERGPVRADKPNPLGSLFTPDSDALDQSAPTFYSALERFVSQSQTKRASAEQWKATISKAPGIKAEEIEWTGVNDWLDAQEGAVSREALSDYLNANGVQVEEILATENGENVGELEWDDGRVWDDPEAWEHEVDDYWLADAEENGIRQDALDFLIHKYSLMPDNGDADVAEARVEEEYADELDEKMRDTAERRARDQYYDNPIYIYETTGNSSGVDLSIFGNDDQGYSIREGGWRFRANSIRGLGDIYSLSEAQVQAQAYAENNDLVQSEDSPERTKWGEFVMRGSSDNYRELKLTLPDIQEDFYNETHFADRNIVAFLRLTDRRLAAEVDSSENIEGTIGFEWEPLTKKDGFGNTGDLRVTFNGETYKRIRTDEAGFESIVGRHEELKGKPGTVLATESGKGRLVVGENGSTLNEIPRENRRNTFFIDEFQSDWHQQGRQEGYMASEKEVEEAKKNIEIARQKMIEANKRFAAVMNDAAVEALQYTEKMADKWGLTEDDLAVDRDSIQKRLSDWQVAYAEGVQQFKTMSSPSDEVIEAKNQADVARSNLSELSQNLSDSIAERNIPNAPFKGDAWVALGMKRAIRMAVDEGRSAIGWPDSEVLVDRWAERYRQLYINQYDGKMVKAAAKLLKAKPVHLTLDGELYTEWHKESGQQGYWIVELTDEMKATAEKGFPLFQKRRNPNGWGAVTPPSNVHPVRLDLQSVRDGYGDEAVDRLPKSVIDRATSSNTVEDMMAQIETIKADLKAKPPKSLFAFVRSRGRKGKIKGPNGISGAADDLKALGLEKLINEKSGRHIDYVRELAEEAGYLQPAADGQTTSINDLLTALQNEANGNPVYAEMDLGDASAHENAETWRVFLDENGVDIYEEDKRVLEAAVRKFVEGAQEDAVTPDEAADMFGFDTGEDLIAALINEGDRERTIRDETERRFKEEYGDLYESGQLANEIETEVETELRARKAEMEFEALTRAVGRLPARRLARQQAQESLAIMPIGEINRRFRSWRRDAETHGRNALAEARKGNWDKVTQSKKFEIVALAMHEEGAKLLERAEKVRADLTKYETSKYRREKIANDYLERIDALLEGYELRKSKQGPSEQRRRQSAADYVAWMTAEGREDEIAAEASLLAEMANDKVWRNLTIDEADYLHATVKNLAHLGRTKDRLLNEQDKRRFNAVIDELVETLDEAGPLGKADRAREKSHRPTLGEKASGFARTSHAWLMRLEHQFRALDGRENGPLWTALFRSFAEAADAESRMSREAAKAVRAAYNIYSMKERYVMHNTSISLPELGPSKGKRWTKMDVISMALNWGVQYNRDALLEGYGWQAGQVEAALNRVMTDKDWDFVEAIWEEAGRYKDEAFALEKAMTGIEPKAVEGVSFTLPSGRVIEGKYYHIEYDAQQMGGKARRQKRQEDRQALSERGKSFTRPMTKNGGLIERVGSGGKPVRLHISVFEKSVMETIHDIAYRRAVIDASRIIRNDRFADAYEVTSGKEAYEQLMPWVEAIAKPPMEVVHGPAQVFVTLRRNLPVAFMGFKIGTAMIQVSGLAAAVPILGTARVAGGVAKAFAGGPFSVLSAWQAVSEKSEFMRDRPMGYDRDVREITTAMGASNPLGSMKRNAFMLISAMDIGISTPIWIAAYDKAMDGKADGIAAGDEEAAILWADSVVRRTQTAGRTQDLARVQRDTEFWKQLTMIYGYFGGLYGYTAQQVRSVRSGETNAAQFAWFATMLFVVVPLLAEFLGGRLVPDDDDDETLAGNMGRSVLSNFAGMFPVVRDAVNYQIKPQYGYNMSPVASGAEDVVRATTMFNDGEVTESEVKNAMRAVGGLFGLPASQMIITGDYMWDVMNGEEDPLEDPVDAAQEALLRSKR